MNDTISMTPHEHNHDALDSRLDELLVARCVSTRKDFGDAVLAAIEAGAGDSLDVLIDKRLTALPLRTKSARTERIFTGVIEKIRFRKLISWSAPAFAALIATVLALPVFLHRESSIPAETLVSQAIANDPTLGILLNTETFSNDIIFDGETVSTVAGISDNTLAWLEVLTNNES